MDGVAHLRREAPLHALMLGVMVAAMASHSALASIAGAALLVAVSVPCAALSRTREPFRAHVLDLWAMALALLLFLPQGVVPGQHHAVTVHSGTAFAAVGAAWLCARVWLAVRAADDRRVAMVSAGLTGAGLVAMAVLCAAG